MKKIQTFAYQIGIVLSNPFIYFAVCFAIALGISMTRVFSPFTSPFDEHTHLSYVQYAYSWVIPAEGYPMNSWAKAAFSCHPHAIYANLTEIPCGTIADGKFYPTGGTNTSQTWPPIYFFLVAILMRIPMIWISDPLFSARFVTAILWSLGTAWIGLQVWKLTNTKSFGIAVSALLVALPTFYYFTSNVSPHSLNPLLIATALAISTKIVGVVSSFGDIRDTEAPGNAWTYLFRSKWIYLFAILGLILAFAVPQSLTIIGFSVLFTVLWIFNLEKINLKQKLIFSVFVSAAGAVSTFLFTRVFAFWQWQVWARAIPVSTEVDPGLANVDPPKTEYISPIVMFFNRLWSFWPEGLNPGFPQGKDVSAVIGVWGFILAGLSVTAIVIWKKSDWLGPLMLSLLIAAPVFSIAYNLIFTTDVPVRYGIVFPILGILSLANNRLSRPIVVVLLVLSAFTYLTAFVLDPTYVETQGCGLDAATQLITCPK